MPQPAPTPLAAPAHTPAPLWRPALVLFAVLTLVTGLAYPLVVTGLAQALFPAAAGGSLILREGRAVGSELIGQSFSGPGHFWGRPSATGTTPYDALASGGSNLGPSHPGLVEAVAERVRRLKASDPAQAAPVPVDLVTASASGLDPHISRAAALWQLPRVARERGLPPATVARLVDEASEWPWLGFLGEPRVHVLRLNLALEALPAP